VGVTIATSTRFVGILADVEFGIAAWTLLDRTMLTLSINASTTKRKCFISSSYQKTKTPGTLLPGVDEFGMMVAGPAAIRRSDSASLLAALYYTTAGQEMQRFDALLTVSQRRDRLVPNVGSSHFPGRMPIDRQ
jgi:hypothetical protein